MSGPSNSVSLPSTMALIPVVYLLARSNEKPNGVKVRHIRDYLIVSGLRSLFRGAAETAANGYIRAISKADPKEEAYSALYLHIPRNRRYRIKPEDVRSAAGLCSPLMQAYLAFLYAERARSWPSGRGLDDVLRRGLLNDRLDVHHIFPKKLMQGYDVSPDKLNTAANYAILSQADNAELSDKDPLVVWQNLNVDQRGWAKKQLCITMAREDLLKPKNYEEFFEFRAQQLAEQLNAFLNLH
jgi:hypothetical protein